jgi:hypothetical protein
MEENNLLVEQYLDSLESPDLTSEQGGRLQNEFIRQCQGNPELQLAYLLHPRTGTDMDNPEVQRTISGLRAVVAQSKRPTSGMS